MSTPLVGIALAAYEPNISYFEAQLASLIAQDYQNWFCYITFDSSLETVRTEPTLQKFFADSRFRWHQNECQLGATKNFEAAILLCSEEGPDYICCCDQDDIWFSNKVSRQVETIRGCPKFSIAHCDMHVLKGHDTEFLRLSDTAWVLEKRGVQHVSPPDLLIRSVISGAGMIMDVELVRKYPLIPHPAFEHDHWFPFVASTLGGVYPIKEALYDYRIHGSNVSGLTEYNSFFHRNKRLPELTVVQKCMVAFNGSAARCREAQAAGVQVRKIDEIMTNSFFDLGLLYLLRAARMIWTDRPLARACISRAGGKIFRFIYRGFGHHRYR